MHRICYISRNYRGLTSSGNKAKTDNEMTLAEMGAVNLGLRQTTYRNKLLTFFLNLAGIVKYACSVKKGDVMVLQYPVKKYFFFICRMAHLRKAKVVALIHDLGSMRRKKLTETQEIERLMNADYVIASNEVMKQWLTDKGYTHPTGSLGMHDYKTSSTPSEGKEPEQENHAKVPVVVYAGALAMRKNAFILQLPETIHNYQLHIYGDAAGLPTLQPSATVVVKGFLPADQFCEKARGDYGLVWDGDAVDACTGNFGEYLRYNSPHKVSFYIRAGLPVIVWREAALAALIEEEGVGICIDSIKQLETLLPTITPEQLEEMHRNVLRVGQKMGEGGFFRDALEQALKTIG